MSPQTPHSQTLSPDVPGCEAEAHSGDIWKSTCSSSSLTLTAASRCMQQQPPGAMMAAEPHPGIPLYHNEPMPEAFASQSHSEVSCLKSHFDIDLLGGSYKQQCTARAQQESSVGSLPQEPIRVKRCLGCHLRMSNIPPSGPPYKSSKHLTQKQAQETAKPPLPSRPFGPVLLLLQPLRHVLTALHCKQASARLRCAGDFSSLPLLPACSRMAAVISRTPCSLPLHSLCRVMPSQAQALRAPQNPTSPGRASELQRPHPNRLGLSAGVAVAQWRAPSALSRIKKTDRSKPESRAHFRTLS